MDYPDMNFNHTNDPEYGFESRFEFDGDGPSEIINQDTEYNLDMNNSTHILASNIDFTMADG